MDELGRLEASLRSGFILAERLQGDVAPVPIAVADHAERSGDLREIEVAPARRPAIAIGEVHMKDLPTGFHDALVERALLDVGMEGIEEQAQVLPVQLLEERERLPDPVDQGGLIPVERLQGQPGLRFEVGELGQRFPEPPPGLLVAAAAAEEADDHDRARWFKLLLHEA